MNIVEHITHTHIRTLTRKSLAHNFNVRACDNKFIYTTYIHKMCLSAHLNEARKVLHLNIIRNICICDSECALMPISEIWLHCVQLKTPSGRDVVNMWYIITKFNLVPPVWNPSHVYWIALILIACVMVSTHVVNICRKRSKYLQRKFLIGVTANICLEYLRKTVCSLVCQIV